MSEENQRKPSPFTTWPWQSASVTSVTPCWSKQVRSRPGWGEDDRVVPPDGGPAQSWESVRGVDNTTRDIFRKFFLSQRVTVARSRCPAGSLPCPCMAGSVSRSWVKVTGGASNLFKNFVLKCKTWLGAQSLSGSAWIFTCGTFGDHHPPR